MLSSPGFARDQSQYASLPFLSVPSSNGGSDSAVDHWPVLTFLLGTRKSVE